MNKLSLSSQWLLTIHFEGRFSSLKKFQKTPQEVPVRIIVQYTCIDVAALLLLLLLLLLGQVVAVPDGGVPAEEGGGAGDGAEDAVVVVVLVAALQPGLVAVVAHAGVAVVVVVAAAAAAQEVPLAQLAPLLASARKGVDAHARLLNQRIAEKLSFSRAHLDYVTQPCDISHMTI